MSEIRISVDHSATDHYRAYCMTCDNRSEPNGVER